MAKKVEKTVEDQNLENVQEALSTSGQWIEKNLNTIEWVLLVVIAVVCGCFAINNYVIKPKAVEAQNEVAKATFYFNAGDYQQALNGDEADCIGFEAIADKYSHYQAGKLAALYAGICCYEQANYEDAAKYLKNFSAKDLTIAPAALCRLGDAYVELGDLAKAVSAFENAAKSENEVVAPFALKKAGIVYLEQGDKKAANRAFQLIKDNYKTSTEAQDIDKYIEFSK